MLRDYGRELTELHQDRQRFEQRMKSGLCHSREVQLLEKYRFYIKDLLQRKESKAATICLALTQLEGRYSLIKAAAFNRLTHYTILPTPSVQEKIRRFAHLLEKVEVRAETFCKAKAIAYIACSNTPDCTPNLAPQKLKKALTSLEKLYHQNTKGAIHRICLVGYQNRLVQQKRRIAQLEEENIRLNQLLYSKHSPNTTATEPVDFERVVQLDRLLKEKDRDIKSLVRAGKDVQARYELKLERLQEQLNKLNYVNGRLMEELEEVRQRHGDLSDIPAELQADNSLSLQLFNQDEKNKDLQLELSDKYLRQVIQLKQNIESVKMNFLSLLQRPMNCQREVLINLMYLLNFSDDEKKMVARMPYLSELLG